MDRLEEIREKISQCDDRIIEELVNRMNYMKELIEVKKQTGAPIIQPEQDKEQEDALENKVKDHEFQDEILHIFKYIMKSSRKIQTKSLLDYNIFLIGFMGAGKSTVADGLENMLEMERIEMDTLIAEKQGMSIPQIFEEYGEAFFRDLESNLLIELQKKSQAIVSCGGGVVMRPENAEHMKKHGRVVLLTASPKTIFERVKDSKDRPILNDNMNVAFIEELMEKRREKYLATADIIVETDGKNVVEICEEILSRLIMLDRG